MDNPGDKIKELVLVETGKKLGRRLMNREMRGILRNTNWPAVRSALDIDSIALQAAQIIYKSSVRRPIHLGDTQILEQHDQKAARPIKNYIVLDSHMATVDAAQQEYRWGFSNTYNRRQGMVNMVGSAKDLEAIRLYQPIIPVPASGINLDTARITILVKEFSAQACITANGQRYHWMTRPELNLLLGAPQKFIELRTKEFGDGLFSFRTPITSFSHLTISFGNPDNLLTFKKDRLKATFTYGATTTITFTEDSLFTADTELRIKDFTTNAPNVDAAVINAINSANGLSGTFISGTQFTVPVNTSEITGIAGLTVDVFFQERRFVMPMELTFSD